jgi:hypothetical protein
VVKVTPKDIILRRTDRNGETHTATLERDRRSYLKVGDRVRYDKKRNRLRRTLSGEEE